MPFNIDRMALPDLEKGDFILSLSSSIEDKCSHTRSDGVASLVNESYSECVKRWNSAFFNKVQLLSEDDFVQFSKRTRVLEFRYLSRFYLTYLEWMLQDMRSIKDYLGNPTDAQAKVERIGQMLHNYCTKYSLFAVH